MKCEGCGKNKTCYDYYGHAMCRLCIEKYKNSVRKTKLGRFIDSVGENISHFSDILSDDPLRGRWP